MMLQSMTGFSRLDGQVGRYQWAWELRSVNGKGLDIRLRLPPGQERLEAEARRVLGQHFARGNIQASLTLQAGEGRLNAVINDAALTAIVALRERLGDLIDPAPLKLDTLLAIRGVVDFKEEQDEEGPADALAQAVIAGLDKAGRAMRDMRQSEGAALASILGGHIDMIERLATTIADDPTRAPEQIRLRLENQLAQLMDTPIALDRDRLYAEVALLATKADIREEIDRLSAHIAAARDLLANGGPVGRKLDFLAQEFNRESNTICSKSNSAAVTAAGIELKVVIDQFREQVQNLE